MKQYRTLKHAMYALDALPPDQQSMYEAVWEFSQQEPDWDTFTAFWFAHIERLQPQLTRQEITATPMFNICEDLDVRLAINQGYTRPGDYRDELQMIIEQKFPSTCICWLWTCYASHGARDGTSRRASQPSLSRYHRRYARTGAP